MPLGQRVAHMAPERCRCLQICAASVAAGAATPSVPRREKLEQGGTLDFPRVASFSRGHLAVYARSLPPDDAPLANEPLEKEVGPDPRLLGAV